MNIDGRQRSLSPNKIQSEGNLSPWRIRVTVQAEQEDQMNNGSSPRRRLLTPGSRTMKVPLKDDSGIWEPTPKRRRGRPRKSDIENGVVTPRKATPARAKGSPGYTPGPATTGSTTGSTTGNTTGKRKRGRPSKSLPDQSVIQSVEADRFRHVAETSPSPQRESPINLVADGASDDDGYDDIWNPSGLGYSAGLEHSHSASFTGHSPTPPERQQYSPPDSHSAEITQTTDVQAVSSPAKELSSPRRDHPNAPSPDHTLHAGHTPRPRRIYPTPTSSSVAEEESSATQKRSPHKEIQREEPSKLLPDPTDEHREFDTIMESEGFSMVSLDTLPSARQLALNSSLSASKGVLKPFLNRQSRNNSERKSRVSFDSHAAVLEVDSATSHQTQSAPERVPLNDASPLRSLNNIQHESAAAKQAPTVQDSTPKLSPAPAQAGAFTIGTKKRSFLSLVRLVRAGIALQGVLRRQRNGSVLHRPSFSSSGSRAREESGDPEGTRKRLEQLFSGFDPETQRELRAGLRFGEELAKRKREAERHRQEEEDRQPREAMEENIVTETRRESPPAKTPQSRRGSGSNARETSSTILSQRQAEWQHEREAVSREIQSASSSRIIVIESDTDAQQLSEEDEELESEKGASEDGGYDIWQEEANLSHSHISSRSLSQENQLSQPPQNETSSPQRGDEDVDLEDNVNTLPPAPWDRQQGDMPYLGKSRLGRLREEEIDLSALLQKRNSPNTRKYYGYSSPQTNTSQHAPSSATRTPATSKSRLATSRPRVDLTSPAQSRVTKSSPQAFDGARSEQEDQGESSPLRSPSQSPDRPHFQWNENGETDGDHVMSHDLGDEQVQDEEIDIVIENTGGSRSPSVHERSALTPPPEQQNNTAPASASWFRRLSSFTPGWWGSASPEKDAPQEGVEEKEETVEEEGGEEEEIEEEGNEENWDENQLPQSQDAPVRGEVEYPSLPQSPYVQSAKTERIHKQSLQRKPLAVSGYFTNDHYIALRRLYRLAKRSPELFPYYPTEERAEIIGDWLWTADGDYGVPVTELQFAIIDKFVDELAEADIQNGGSGEIGWTEEDLHKRLFSIIVGEQIRKDRKAKIQEETAERMQNGYRQTSSKLRY